MGEYVIWLEDKRADVVDTDKIYKVSRPAHLQEPIVRCRDCKHCYEERRDTLLSGWVSVSVCNSPQWSTASLMPSHEVEPNGFCKWGEKKEDEEVQHG